MKILLILWSFFAPCFYFSVAALKADQTIKGSYVKFHIDLRNVSFYKEKERNYKEDDVKSAPKKSSVSYSASKKSDKQTQKIKKRAPVIEKIKEKNTSAKLENLKTTYKLFASPIDGAQKIDNNPSPQNLLGWMFDNTNRVYVNPADKRGPKIELRLNENRTSKEEQDILASADIFPILNDRRTQKKIKRARNSIKFAYNLARNEPPNDNGTQRRTVKIMKTVKNSINFYDNVHETLKKEFGEIAYAQSPPIDKKTENKCYRYILGESFENTKNQLRDLKIINKELEKCSRMFPYKSLS